MYTLYYSPGSCSLAVHVLLRELNVPFELKETNLAKGDNRDPEFLSINPRGQVPVLQDNDVILREGGAILFSLAEKFASPLLPSSGKNRTATLEWLCFTNATLHPAYARIFFLRRNDGTETQFTRGYATIQHYWDEIEAHLSTHTFLVGDNPTIADILMTVIANWTKKFEMPITFGSNTLAMVKKIANRPAFIDAMQAEKIAYLL